MKKWEDNNNELKKWELFSQQREFDEIHKIGYFNYKYTLFF